MELAVISIDAGQSQFDAGAIEALATRLSDTSWSAVYVSADLAGTVRGLDGFPGPSPDVVTTLDLERVISDHSGGHVLAVADPQSIRALAAGTYDVAVEVVPLPEPGSLTCFRASRSGVRSVICVNDTLHLSAAAADATSREDAQIS
ncbi:hypothetical protein [Nocardia alni]|uniref:hypothetical protein n=1 Tax=Nocardia alni TaxID=2815723 RepID=UPI001C242F86|nr:hypothetical protein [Nocardia alni]